MIRLNLAQLADVVGGELLRPADAQRSVDTVSIDSRTATAGALFVPLVGERADGHQYIPDAVAAGCAGYLCRRGHEREQPGAVVVDDPENALLGLGAWVRDEVAPTVVAITGSSGKTTTKDLTAAAVAAGRTVVANEGSFNNELGVPLTCCRLEPETEVLVAEVGARGAGHVAMLSSVLRQDIAVVTTVSAAHLATFGDIDTIARSKAEIVEALEPDGVAVLNADDLRVAAMRERAGGEVVTFGLAAQADWRAVDVTFDDLARARFRVVRRGAQGREGLDVRLAVPGGHNVSNALAALAVAERCGVDAEAAVAALASARLSSWRMELLRTPDGVAVLNDAYNANPASTEAALRTLAKVRAGSGEGRRWAVLGQMAELGETSAAEHRRIGRLAVELGVDTLVVVGAAPLVEGARGVATGTEVVGVEDADEALDVVRRGVSAGDVVLVKGSRVVGLERLAAALGGERVQEWAGGGGRATGGWDDGGAGGGGRATGGWDDGGAGGGGRATS